MIPAYRCPTCKDWGDIVLPDGHIEPCPAVCEAVRPAQPAAAQPQDGGAK